MFKAYNLNDKTDYPVFIAFDDVRRIAMVDFDKAELSEGQGRFVSALVTTRDGEVFSVGMDGIDQLESHFNLDINF